MFYDLQAALFSIQVVVGNDAEVLWLKPLIALTLQQFSEAPIPKSSIIIDLYH